VQFLIPALTGAREPAAPTSLPSLRALSVFNGYLILLIPTKYGHLLFQNRETAHSGDFIFI